MFYNTMIVDSIKNLDKYLKIFSSINNKESSKQSTMSSFEVNKNSSLLFIFKGNGKIASSYKENLDSNEILSVIDIKEDMFAIVIANERYLVQLNDGECLKYDLG